MFRQLLKITCILEIYLFLENRYLEKLIGQCISKNSLFSREKDFPLDVSCARSHASKNVS